MSYALQPFLREANLYSVKNEFEVVPGDDQVHMLSGDTKLGTHVAHASLELSMLYSCLYLPDSAGLYHHP